MSGPSGPEDFNHEGQPRDKIEKVPEGDLWTGVEVWAMRSVVARLEAMESKYPHEDREEILLSLLARDKQLLGGRVVLTKGKEG